MEEEERQLLIVPDKDAIHSVFMRSVPMGCVAGIAPEWDRISYSPGTDGVSRVGGRVGGRSVGRSAPWVRK